MEDKELKQLKKLATLQEEPNLAFFDELEDLNDKLEALQGVLSEINGKEVYNYQNELNTLYKAILSLTESVKGKDMVVNVESNKKELENMSNTLKSILDESKKEQSVNVKLIIK
jgi:hypothetical protein